MNELAPSILSADFGDLRGQVLATREGGASYMHIDVMDGHFVPEISFGEPIIRSVRQMTDRVVDVHLMVTNPGDHFEACVKAGADSITFHYEAVEGGAGAYGGPRDPGKACALSEEFIDRLHALGCKAGISVKPRTPLEEIYPLLDKLEMVLIMSVEPGFGGQKYMPESTERIRALRAEAQKRNPALRIQVDGGVKTDNAAMILEAGADLIVAGSAVFGDDAEGRTRAFMDILRA